MSNPPTRQIYLPNYKVNISVPASYSDEQITTAIQRNKILIERASPVVAQTHQYLLNALGKDDAGDGLTTPGLNITEKQARQKGIAPAVQSAQNASEYTHADQVALLRHYAAQRAINSANQHPHSAQIVQQAKARLLPTDRLTAINEKASQDLIKAVTTPVLNHALDYGAPGASQQLAQMKGYRAGLARGVLGFSSPVSLGLTAALGPIAAEPMGTKILLGALGAPAAVGAVNRVQAGDTGGALGELTAFGLPFLFHGAELAQRAKDAWDYHSGVRWMNRNLGVDFDVPEQTNFTPNADANAHGAEFHPNTAPTSGAVNYLVKAGHFTALPRVTSKLYIDSAVEDPIGLDTLSPLDKAVPTPFEQETSEQQTERWDHSDGFIDNNVMGDEQRHGSIVRYQPNLSRPLNNFTFWPSPSNAILPSGILSSGLSKVHPINSIIAKSSLPQLTTLSRTNELAKSLPIGMPKRLFDDILFQRSSDIYRVLHGGYAQTGFSQPLHEQTFVLPPPIENFIARQSPKTYQSNFLNIIDGAESEDENRTHFIQPSPFSNEVPLEHQKSIDSETNNQGKYNLYHVFNKERDEEEDLADLPMLRVKVNLTKAKGHLGKDWYDRYLKYVMYETPIKRYRLQTVLRGETLARAREYFKDFPEVLNSPIVPRDRLRDKVYGTVLDDDLSPSRHQIAINGRVALDPEDLIFVIVEEAVHIAQKLQEMEFDNSVPYEERLHEIQAKAAAQHITGYHSGEKYVRIRARLLWNGIVPTE